MNERDQERAPSSKDILYGLVSRDYADERQIADRQDPNALLRFLASTVSVEDVEERINSPECADLILTTTVALENAQITDSFKGFITGNVIKAFAYQTSIDESVSAENLGLNTDNYPGGIYDSTEARTLEGQALRRYLLEITKTYILIPDDLGDRSPIVMEPGSFAHAMMFFDEWSLDYVARYGADVLDGVPLGSHMEWAQIVHIMRPGEIEDTGWVNLIEALKDLRDKGDDQP